MLWDAPERRHPLVKEAMAILTAVHLSVAVHVRVIVRNREVGINPLKLVDVVVDRIHICKQNHRSVTQFSDLFVYDLENVSYQKLNEVVAPTIVPVINSQITTNLVCIKFDV